ncbi:MAG: hypothetical protein WBB25_04265 [Sulfitobacter sp.]
MKRRSFVLCVPAILAAPALISGCALRRGPPLPGSLQDVDALTRAIARMPPSVDIAEARAAASLAYSETYRLALTYGIVDPPLLHNAKVNAGRKPRGLCWHWAEDLTARLSAQNYHSLRMHRAIANADDPLVIDHSTAIIAAVGADWRDGVVLDPWRGGGTLFWAPVREDSHYDWEERETVMRRYGRIRYARQGAN